MILVEVTINDEQLERLFKLHPNLKPDSSVRDVSRLVQAIVDGGSCEWLHTPPVK